MNNSEEKLIEEIVAYAEKEFGDGERVRKRITELLTEGLSIDEAIEKTSWEFYQ